MMKMIISVSKFGRKPTNASQITFTAEIQGITLSADAVSLVRSPDLNGDGSVNFADTFLFVSYLAAATGYCGNLNGDPYNLVNFWDTSKLLPFLSAATSCP